MAAANDRQSERTIRTTNPPVIRPHRRRGGSRRGRDYSRSRQVMVGTASLGRSFRRGVTAPGSRCSRRARRRRPCCVADHVGSQPRREQGRLSPPGAGGRADLQGTGLRPAEEAPTYPLGGRAGKENRVERITFPAPVLEIRRDSRSEKKGTYLRERPRNVQLCVQVI